MTAIQWDISPHMGTVICELVLFNRVLKLTLGIQLSGLYNSLNIIVGEK